MCGVLVEVVKPDGTHETLPCSGFAFMWGGERFDRRVSCGHEQRSTTTAYRWGIFDTVQGRWWPRAFNSAEDAQKHYDECRGPGSRGEVREWMTAPPVTTV